MSAPMVCTKVLPIRCCGGVCRTCISAVASIVLCLVGVVVSRTSRSEHQCAEMLVWRRVPWTSRHLHIFVFVAALLITSRTSASGGVPAKLLSVPFCLISRAINRLRTSARSLSTLLMSFHRHEMGLRPVLDRHVRPSPLRGWASNLSCHATSSARALATPSHKSVACFAAHFFQHTDRALCTSIFLTSFGHTYLVSSFISSPKTSVCQYGHLCLDHGSRTSLLLQVLLLASTSELLEPVSSKLLFVRDTIFWSRRFLPITERPRWKVPALLQGHVLP